MFERKEMNPAEYFRQYRTALGFSNQAHAKAFLAAKDVLPGVDLAYVEKLNSRLEELLFKLLALPVLSTLHPNQAAFCQKQLHHPYQSILKAGLIPKLNNQGRRPEDVLFSWLRGYTVCALFMPAIAKIFSVSEDAIGLIGGDDLQHIENFKRTPTADLSITRAKQEFEIEFQSGFQGINDIKEHKVRQAQRRWEDNQVATVCIHADVFNGQVAFVRLDTIAASDMNWVTRQQMEGQSVFAIDQNHFKWRLLDALPQESDLELGL